MPIEVSPSKTTAPISAQPSRSVPINHDENEDLAWECFQKVVTDEDVVACYDMSLKEFEHSVVHDLFKVCNFAFASPCCFTLFSFNKFFIFFILGNVKVHCNVSAGHKNGQDKDSA